MKVLLGSSSPPDKGAGIISYVKEVAQELRSRNIEVHLVSPSPESYTWLKETGCIHHSLGQFSDPEEAIHYLAELVKQESINMVINNDHPYLQSAAPLIDAHFVSVVHLSSTNVFTLARYNAACLDAIVVISEDMRNKLLSFENIDKGRIRLIFNGIRPLNYIEKSPSVAQPLRLFYAGGGIRRKGFDRVLRLVEALANSSAQVELILCGNYSARVIQKLSKFKFVRPIGRIPRDLFLDSLAKADVFLLPSRKEGCPMALIEAMSLGLVPVVSDGEGAMKEMVQSGVNGYVCRQAKWSDDALGYIESLSRSHSRRVYMGEQARKAYEQRFCISGTVDKLLAIGNEPKLGKTAPASVRALKWHRPLNPGKNKSPLLDRFYIKFGFLRQHSVLSKRF